MYLVKSYEELLAQLGKNTHPEEWVYLPVRAEVQRVHPLYLNLPGTAHCVANIKTVSGKTGRPLPAFNKSTQSPLVLQTDRAKDETWRR